MTTESVQIDWLTLDDHIQQRARISDETINAYADLYTEGYDLGPVIAFMGPEFDEPVVVDGFHRLQAAQKAVLGEIPVDLHEGTFRDALFFACGANKHGRQRSRHDLRRTVSTMLNDNEWQGWPNTTIAAHVGVTEGYVRKLRKELGLSSYSTKIVARDGQTFPMDTTKIGKREPSAIDAECVDLVPPSPVAAAPEGTETSQALTTRSTQAPLDHEHAARAGHGVQTTAAAQLHGRDYLDLKIGPC